MNDEIKKILDIFTKYKDDWYSVEYILKPKQCVALYDYITNLQHTKEHLGEVLHEQDEELEEEKRINQEDLKLIDKLEERIEKAIEYIKEDMYSEPNELYGLIDGEHLLNILNGRSDE